jgi:APA family basic amino acid/polyamine antiporter
MERHLSFWDLIAMGIGGTVGSGLFVLAGMVAQFAGPAATVSWVLSGTAALLSGSLAPVEAWSPLWGLLGMWLALSERSAELAANWGCQEH